MTGVIVSRMLDFVALVTAIIAAWLWYKSSIAGTRRIHMNETLDARDLNRIITGMNRSQILNRRAALATAISTLAVALKFVVDLFIPS